MKEETKKKQANLEENQVGWFRWYMKFPQILAITIFVLLAIWGIVDAAVFGYSVDVGGWYRSDYVHYYGIMGIKENAFLCWFIWAAIGGVLAGLTYFFAKISISHKVLQMVYMQKMLGDQIEDKNVLVLEAKKSFGAEENKPAPVVQTATKETDVPAKVEQAESQATDEPVKEDSVPAPQEAKDESQKELKEE